MHPPSLSRMYQDCIRAAGNDPSCVEFFRLVNPAVTRMASRIAYQYNCARDIEDVVQEVNLKLMAAGESLFHAIPADPKAALAYFSVLAANSARDFFRSRGAVKRGSDATVSLDAHTALATTLGTPPDFDKEILLRSIEKFLPVDRRERTIFHLYYTQGFTAKEIAAIPALKLSLKGVESLVLRITSRIRERMQRPAAKGKSN
jgi:RNA polymerase sigma-70 factor (ECF subfamily)